MEDGIEMQTGTEGGIFAGLKRIVSGENFSSLVLNSGVGNVMLLLLHLIPEKLFR